MQSIVKQRELNPENLVMASQVLIELLFVQLVQEAIKSSTPPSNKDPVDHEAAFYRIEQVGFVVGQRLHHHQLHQLSLKLSDRSVAQKKTPPTFDSAIDRIKFLCKDFWASIFAKNIDNLKTNNRGVFVLQDSDFSWIRRFAAADHAFDQTSQLAVLYLAFPCGLLRGALAAHGMQCTVTAEIPSFPQCVFQIRTI